MQAERTEKRGGSRILFAVLLLLLFLASALAAFFLMGGHKSLPMFKKAPIAQVATGQLKAMRLPAPGKLEEDELESYFAEAAAFAAENGYNTLLFEAKQGATVLWRDDILPTAAGVAAQDTWRHKSDPLAILCRAVAGKNLQLWLEVDPFAGGGQPPEKDKSRLAALAGERGGLEAGFAYDDTEYLALLAQSLGALPARYPIAGVVFTGLESAAGADASDFSTIFKAFLQDVHTGFANTGRMPGLGLCYTEGAGPVGPAYAKGLTEEGLLRWSLPALKTGAGTARRLQAAAAPGSGLVLPLPEGDNGLFLFYAQRSEALAGILYGDYPEVMEKDDYYSFLSASLEQVDSPLPAGFEPLQALGVNYPAQNSKHSTEQVYIMGNSNPAHPLLLDGAAVESRAEGGSFGIAVTLAMGENSFTFTNGESSFTLKLERTEPVAGPAPTYPQDHTHEAKEGQAIRVVSQIASALTDPGDLSAINETLPAGAVFIADGSVQTRRWNANMGRTDTTWAYRLKSGDYVHAVNCVWLDAAEDATASFTGITVTPDEEKRGEWLDFEGRGTPAAYIAHNGEEGLLTLTFYDTAITLPEGFSSTLVESAAVEQQANGSLTLSLKVPELWGYSIEYPEGRTRLFLKAAPRRASNPAKPLEGIRVMLDAGHGDTDAGAPGIMGDIGPNEKDMNLAQAQAIAYRLKQLGATVLMTRDDDTFYELEERLAMQNEQKPDFFLSVHHNSVELDRDRSDAKGLESYYYHPYTAPPSKAFAQNLIQHIAQGSGRVQRKDAEWTYFYVTRTTVCPSVLFEYGFVVSPTEFEDIISADGLYAVAFSTVEALTATLPD